MRSTCITMKVTTMVVGIVILMSMQFKATLAQDFLPGDCWKDIAACKSGAATEEDFHNDCCPVLLQVTSNDTSCFCGVQPILEQDPKAADVVAEMLDHCDMDTTFDEVCDASGPVASGPETPSASAPAPSLPCWDDLETCITKNIDRSESMPEFNISSPMFNVTEFLCCSLVKETATAKKPCFCGVTSLLELEPSQTPAVMQVVAGCGIAESVVSLKSFCKGVSPSLASGPMTQSPDGIAPSPAFGNITGDSKAQEGAASKIVVAGSTLSSLIMFLSYILF